MKYWLGNNGIMSGRADGSVFMRNHVVRGMAMPSNPQTPAQTVQRGDFGSRSGNWNALTDEQRATWNASSVVLVDNLGHNVTLSGKGLYVALNRNLFNAGQAVLTTAPIPASPLSVSSLATDAHSTPGGGVNLDFTPDPIPAGTTWLVYATPTLSAGTYRPGRSRYRLVTVLPAATASPQDIETEYVALFGQPVLGGTVFIKIIPIKNSTGYSAPPTIARTIVVA